MSGQIDAGGILDIAMAGTSATLLARKWESALLVNVDNDTLRRILDNPEAMAAVERIEGWRSLGDNIIETIINKSETVSFPPSSTPVCRGNWDWRKRIKRWCSTICAAGSG